MKTPASLNNGWCHGTNGIGCQPVSSQNASSGSAFVRNVTPFPVPQPALLVRQAGLRRASSTVDRLARVDRCGQREAQRGGLFVLVTRTGAAPVGGPPGCEQLGVLHDAEPPAAVDARATAGAGAVRASWRGGVVAGGDAVVRVEVEGEVVAAVRVVFVQVTRSRNWRLVLAVSRSESRS